jgi:hypothetical protein
MSAACLLRVALAAAAIAKLLLPGRSNTAVKNFWHCRLKSGSGTTTNRYVKALRHSKVLPGSCCCCSCKLATPTGPCTVTKAAWLLTLHSPHAQPTAVDEPFALVELRRFILENHNLRYLLNEVPEKDKLYPVSLPAFPSTAPTGHVRKQVGHRW